MLAAKEAAGLADQPPRGKSGANAASLRAGNMRQEEAFCSLSLGVFKRCSAALWLLMKDKEEIM